MRTPRVVGFVCRNRFEAREFVWAGIVRSVYVRSPVDLAVLDFALFGRKVLGDGKGPFL